MQPAVGHDVDQQGTPAMVLRQLQFSQMVVKRNVGDVTHEESLRSFAPAGNCLYWILAHVVATRSGFLGALGGVPVWSKSECQRFDQHAPPLENERGIKPLAELWRDFDLAHERLVETLGRLTPEDLARPVPAEFVDDLSKTRAEVLPVLGFHDAYHAGQTGLIRRLLGKPPADL
jgi:uncharacterized damage-inducible protein DinB